MQGMRLGLGGDGNVVNTQTDGTRVMGDSRGGWENNLSTPSRRVSCCYTTAAAAATAAGCSSGSLAAAISCSVVGPSGAGAGCSSVPCLPRRAQPQQPLPPFSAPPLVPAPASRPRRRRLGFAAASASACLASVSTGSAAGSRRLPRSILESTRHFSRSTAAASCSTPAAPPGSALLRENCGRANKTIGRVGFQHKLRKPRCSAVQQVVVGRLAASRFPPCHPAS